jgi:DNA-binding transcriptional regulator YiaG
MQTFRLLEEGRLLRIDESGEFLPSNPSQTDWARIDSLTAHEIEEMARNDESWPYDEVGAISDLNFDIEGLCKKLDMNHEQFAKTFMIPQGLISHYLNHIRPLDLVTHSYLKVIEKNPEAVIEALRN